MKKNKIKKLKPENLGKLMSKVNKNTKHEPSDEFFYSINDTIELGSLDKSLVEKITTRFLSKNGKPKTKKDLLKLAENVYKQLKDIESRFTSLMREEMEYMEKKINRLEALLKIKEAKSSSPLVDKNGTQMIVKKRRQ